MPLFNKPIPHIEIPENSEEVARAIYDLLALGVSTSNVFVQHGYKMKWVKWVYDKAKKLEAEAIASIKADPTQTDAQWAGSVSTVKLHKVTVLQDIIKHNPVYGVEKTFEEFVIAITAGE